MHKLRRAASALAAVLLISLVPATALAANQSLKVRGPHNVTAGSNPVYTITGKSQGTRGLAVYADTRRCARKVVREQVRHSSSNPVKYLVSGTFTHTVQITSSKVGSHYICAYLYQRHSPFTTYLHAGLHYTTH